MPSLRSRLLLFMIKNRHLLRFHLKKEIIDWSKNEAILRFRDECEAGANVSAGFQGGLKSRLSQSTASQPNGFYLPGRLRIK